MTESRVSRWALAGGLGIVVLLVASSGHAQVNPDAWIYWQCGHVPASHGIGNVCPQPPEPASGLPPLFAPGGGPPPPPPECGQNQCCDTGSGGKPVDLWNGREFFTHTDLVLRGLMDIEIRRSYDSHSELDTALGYGWALSYFLRLYEFPDQSVILRRDCGVRRQFLYTGGAYQTPPGESGTLVKNANGTWTLWERGWEQKIFDAEGRLYRIVSPEGPYLEFTYDNQGKLPLIGLPRYPGDGATGEREVASEYRMTEIREYTPTGGATGRFVTLQYDGNGRLDLVTDSALRTVDYVQDGEGNLTQVLLPESAMLTYLYEDPSDPHNATLLTDSSCTSCGGSTYENSYDGFDRVMSQTHGDHVLEFDYQVPYQKTVLTEKTYDEQGLLLHEGTTTYEFNTVGNPMKVTDALGNVTEYDRDFRMNAVGTRTWEKTGPNPTDLTLLYEESREYTSDDQVDLVTEGVGFPEERTTDYFYENGLLRFVVRPSVVVPVQSKVLELEYYPSTALVRYRKERGFLGDGTAYEYVTELQYDAGTGKLLWVDGPRLGTIDRTSYAYNAVTGNLETMTEPESLVTQYQMYNAQGLSEKVLDPNTVATDYVYDDVGRVRTATVAGDVTQYVYTGTGKLSSVTLPKSALHEMEYFYDSLDRLEFLEDGLGNRIQYTYDSAGNRRREDFKDVGGTVRKTTSFTYDVLHRLKRVVFSDGTFWEYGYDARGNRTSEKDPNNHPATTSEYDSLGRLERTVQKVTSPSLGLHDVVTQYGYDEHDNLIAVTDANLLQTTYVYDDMGRVYQELSPDTGTTTFWYDEAGNVVSKADARLITVSYQYDGLNRILLTDFPTDPDITYVYDASTSCAYGKTRLCFVQDQSGTTEYAYTAKGELETEERYVNAVAESFTTGYFYDPNGNLETLTYPSGRTVTYSYDLADQVTTVTTIPLGGGQQTVAYGVEYEPFGPLKKLVHGNELIREVGFDDQYRVRSIRTADAGLTNVIQDLTYTPDFNGNILGIADNDDPSKSKTFGYDEMDRLTAATGPYGPSGAQAPLGWTYDDVGNRLSYDAPEGTTSYQYLSGTNRIEASSGANNASFTYLPNGALRVVGPLGLGFGDGNRLTSIDDPGLVANYWYSFDGARVNKTTPDMSTTFVYDSEHDLMSEISGPQLLEHVNLNSDLVGIGIGQELALVHADHLGTPMFGTNSAATAVWTYESRPFGDVETTSMTGSIVVHRRQPGHYRDEETAMNYNYYRYYVSEMGRYARPDPIGASFGFGLYPYVINNPMRYIDPFGLAPFKDCPPRQNSFDGTRPGPGLPPEGLQDDPSATAKPKGFWSPRPATPPKYAYPTKWDQNINLSCEDEFGGGWELIGHNVFCQGGMLLNPNSRTKAWASWVKNWIRICEEYVPGAKETCKGMNDLATGTIGRCICCQRKCE